jgi:hypothetical protein
MGDEDKQRAFFLAAMIGDEVLQIPHTKLGLAAPVSTIGCTVRERNSQVRLYLDLGSGLPGEETTTRRIIPLEKAENILLSLKECKKIGQ